MKGQKGNVGGTTNGNPASQPGATALPDTTHLNIKKRPVAVAVAPVGLHVGEPSRNPITPEDVARETIACAREGAVMVHLHVRDRQGRQTADLTEFSKTLDVIREESDIIIQGSTSGICELSLAKRCVSLDGPRVEMASLKMGSAWTRWS
jgi:3-keto-5-aminohexanoate cleavage enzyme